MSDILTRDLVLKFVNLLILPMKENDYCNNLEGRNKIGESKRVKRNLTRLTPGVKSGQLTFDLC